MNQDDNFQNSLLRLLTAQMWMMISMTAAREMFGKSYFALGMAEKAALDYTVANTIGSNYASISPQFVNVPQAQIEGFRPQARIVGFQPRTLGNS